MTRFAPKHRDESGAGGAHQSMPGLKKQKQKKTRTHRKTRKE